MKSIPATASHFGISQIAVWQLIRKNEIRTTINRFGKVEVDSVQIQAVFDSEKQNTHEQEE